MEEIIKEEAYIEPFEKPEEDKFSNLPGYKNVTCRKCGTVYSKALKECPKCKFSFARMLLVSLAVLLFVALLAGSIGFLAIRVGKLEEKVENLEESISSISSSSGYDLTELEYYQSQLIYDGANLAAFGDDYLIYAMQDGCSACEEANEYIYMYLYYGYPDYLPIFFITPESAEEIFFNTLGCENTPTLYRLKKGVVTEEASGVDEVYSMLDAVIKNANSE